MAIHTWDYAPEALEVNVSELLLATADKSDDLVDENVRQVLHDLREHLGMEVIFVSEIRNGNRMFQHVDTAPGKELIATGGGSSLEESFCQCVLDGTLPQLVHDAATHPAFPQLPATPFRVGAHLSAPIVLSNGKVYGTVHFAQPDMSFKPENQWGDSTEEALRAIMERRASVAVEAPLSAQRKSAMEDLL